jgi:hypothetical protein
MEEDYLELCVLMNSWDMYDKEHQERSRTEFRQFLIGMADKGPKHLIGIFKLYMKTHQIEEEVPRSYSEPATLRSFR